MKDLLLHLLTTKLVVNHQKQLLVRWSDTKSSSSIIILESEFPRRKKPLIIPVFFGALFLSICVRLEEVLILTVDI